MLSKLVHFLKNLFLFTLVIGGIQFLIMRFLFEEQSFYYNAFAIYGFLYLITSLIYLAVLYINYNFSDYTGYAFMGSSLLKMFIAILFLIPVLTLKEGNTLRDLMAFFIPYFLFLIFETVFVVKLLHADKEKTI